MKPYFRKIWAVDFEFHVEPGCRPIPLCGVGREVRSGETKIWLPDRGMDAPYTTGPDDLVVAYAAQAEGRIILENGLPQPSHWIDLLTVVRRKANQHGKPLRTGLLDALQIHGLRGMTAADKAAGRELAMKPGPLAPDELQRLVAYCAEDVAATSELFLHLEPMIDWAGDLLAGRYTGRAVARIESEGVPLDDSLLKRLKRDWRKIRDGVRAGASKQYPVFDAQGRVNHSLLEAYLRKENIDWPRTPSGRLSISDETFKERCLAHPQLQQLRDALRILPSNEAPALAVGPDGRNRTGLWPFSSRTGRNQPRASEWIFSQPSWFRFLIMAPPGSTIINLDYSQQEFAIAAALSGDRAMLDCYNSGDPYLHFAILAGAAPSDATKQSHGHVRERYKTAVLGMLYNISSHGLGGQLGSPQTARKLMEEFTRIFRVFRRWQKNTVDAVSLHRETLRTPFGWGIHPLKGVPLNSRSIANWPIQAAGGDIMRIAAVAMVEHGLPVAAVNHDSFLLVCPAAEAAQMRERAVELMEESSRVVLDGVACRVESASFGPGERYYDRKGEIMFQRVLGILGALSDPAPTSQSGKEAA